MKTVISKREFVSVNGDLRTFEELGTDDGVAISIRATYEMAGGGPPKVRMLTLVEGAEEINRTLADTANWHYR